MAEFTLTTQEKKELRAYQRLKSRHLKKLKTLVPEDWEVVINDGLCERLAQLKHDIKCLEVSHGLIGRRWDDEFPTFREILPGWIAKNQKLSTEKKEKKEVREEMVSASVRRKRLAKLKSLVPCDWTVIVNDRLKSTLVQVKHDEKRIEVANDLLGSHWDEEGFVKRMRRWEEASR